MALTSTVVTVLSGSAVIAFVQYVSVWHPTIVNEGISSPVRERLDAGLSSPVDGIPSPITPHSLQKKYSVVLKTPWYGHLGKILSDILGMIDTPLKTMLRSSSHTLVSAMLISGLLLGTGSTVSFMTLKVVGEGKGALLAAKTALSDPWITSSGESMNVTHGYAGNLWEKFPWLLPYRNQVSNFVQESLPGVLDWLEERGNHMLELHNLTDAAIEARYLMESIQGHRTCSQGEIDDLLIQTAKALANLQLATRIEHEAHEEVVQLSNERDSLLESFQQALHQSSFMPLDFPGIELVETDTKLREAHESLSMASSNLSNARRISETSQKRLSLCSSKMILSSSTPPMVNGTHTISQKLKQSYYKIAVEWKFVEGVTDILATVSAALQQSDSGSSAHYRGINLDGLQSFAAAATGPLVGIGKAILVSVESTTSAAVSGSIGVIRLGLGLLQFGMQAILFLSLLFGLLSAKNDPLVQAIKILPFPPEARDRAAAALNKSLGGVFVTLMKLALIHGLFTWISFKIFDAPLVYTCSALSTALSLLPFFPTYAVAFPAFIALAVSDRLLAGFVLVLLHFVATSFGDDMILEEAGGNSYLMSLSLLGGMWAFYPNPVLGCLLGPILLSLLYAFGALHMELMEGTQPKILTGTSVSAPFDTPDFSFATEKSSKAKKRKSGCVDTIGPSREAPRGRSQLHF